MPPSDDSGFRKQLTFVVKERELSDRGKHKCTDIKLKGGKHSREGTCNSSQKTSNRRHIPKPWIAKGREEILRGKRGTSNEHTKGGGD